MLREVEKIKKLLEINLHSNGHRLCSYFGSSFKGIFSKTDLYL